MEKVFDSWENGFVAAGFVLVGGGSFQIGDADDLVTCFARKDSRLILVRFLSFIAGAEVESEFKMPLSFPSFWEWSAFFAKHAIGSRERWLNLRDRFGDEISDDLAELIEVGLDHVSDGNGQDDAEAIMGRVQESVDCLRSRLVSIRDEYSRCLQTVTHKGDLERVKEVSSKIWEIENRLKNLEEIGVFLSEAGIGPDCGVADENHSIVIDIPDEPTGVKSKSTNFSVTFPNGEKICGDTASMTFAMTIFDLGPEKVSGLGLKVSGEPVVADDQKLMKKFPGEALFIGQGWFVNTHSSTREKMLLLKRIGETLNVALKFEWFYREKKKKNKTVDLVLEPEYVAPTLFDGQEIAKDVVKQSGGEKVKSVSAAPVTLAKSSDSDSGGFVRLSDGSYRASDLRRALCRIMKEHSYTIRALAAGLNLPRHAVKMWCKGYGVIKSDELERIARHMGVSVEDFGVRGKWS